jgi:hypothetical protein
LGVVADLSVCVQLALHTMGCRTRLPPSEVADAFVRSALFNKGRTSASDRPARKSPIDR